ncbi:MAG: ATP--guanido phosphotransferase [Eubacteriales bacterium]|nr:ATP--guanido phosphotransferase [Eubacteriales bacterium]
MTENVGNVIVSGRVRLARNYFDLPFSNAERPENAKLCVQRACEAMHNGTDDVYTLHVLNDMAKTNRMALVEQHLISRDLLQNSSVGAALIRKDQQISIMINEEDHLRIQSLIADFDLPAAANAAYETEALLGKVCGFSFDSQLGYLTACPTNTGTGMRASLMLHLPMLTRFKQMGNINQSVAKLGVTMRGIYGEGSEALGDLYQVSNQVTLGRTEDDIVEAVTAVGKQLIDMEGALRERCLTQQQNELKDTILRSYGILKYAVTMDEKEFMQHWSNLRLGTALELLPTSLCTVDELLTIAQNAHSKLYAADHESGAPVNVARCDLIRERLNA